MSERIGLDFTPRDDIPLWKMVVAYLVLLALVAGCFRLTVVPVLRSIGEAMKSKLAEEGK